MLYFYEPDLDTFAFVVCEGNGRDRVCDVHLAEHRLAGQWKSPTLHHPKESSGPEPDFAPFFHDYKIPLISDSAYNCLLPIIGDAVEPLPVEYPGTQATFFSTSCKLWTA